MMTGPSAVALASILLAGALRAAGPPVPPAAASRAVAEDAAGAARVEGTLRVYVGT